MNPPLLFLVFNRGELTATVFERDNETKPRCLSVAAKGAGELHLGDTTICRDWGWAPEYVEAMWLMLQMDAPEDLVIATGQSSTIWQFCETVFDHLGLDAKDFIRTDPKLRRPSDIHFNAGDAKEAHAKIGWEAKYKMPDVARMMVDAQLSNSAGQ